MRDAHHLVDRNDERDAFARRVELGAAHDLLQYRVDAAPKGPVTMAMGCAGADDAPCRGTVDVTALLKAAPVGQWRTAKIRLTCFRKAGTDMARVDEPFVLGTAAALDLSFAEVRLVADPTDAVCPEQ